ncbi:hypothetical protein F0P96_13845 [Hymenobacter busanensis]|uniref:Uncharacterized protein n=1 Tax=Hymenobacter busanensis TaxID=2607656 RepID=A0A7L5A3K3_9BACT|nr:hypothetical protein [Hymenobacter busanensis]KAA9331329.1 hypothetical protein F0P96_13845 [Hymenobacter busanensis]QHJ08480.1 hypothetical protein GUY19_14770 [Hymenobacter busanensis]
MYEAAYENHFRNIRASRPDFLAFARYTHTALTKTDNPALQALAAPFGAQLQALEDSVTDRTAQDGTRQRQTRTAAQVAAAIREWVRELHDVTLVPKLRKRPADFKALLPQGLSGLTEATQQLPKRLEAFHKTLGEYTADFGPEPAQQASALLAELQAAGKAKDTAQKQTQDTIGELGLGWQQLCDALWHTHCVALAQFHAAPEKARAFFNYALVRNPNAGRNGKAAKPSTPTPA